MQKTRQSSKGRNFLYKLVKLLYSISSNTSALFSLASEQNAGGDLYIHGMQQLLSQLCPPFPSGHEVIVGGGWGASPSARRGDAHDASGRLKSF